MTYELAIVGGRVAGCSRALQLARQGHSVLVAERDEFPSYTLSTHLMSPLAMDPGSQNTNPAATLRVGPIDLAEPAFRTGQRRMPTNG